MKSNQVIIPSNRVLSLFTKTLLELSLCQVYFYREARNHLCKNMLYISERILHSDLLRTLTDTPRIPITVIFAGYNRHDR
jgi:hypothetical protein